jgi:hypothetical protein
MRLASLRTDTYPTLTVAHKLMGESDKRLVITLFPSDNDTITVSHDPNVALGKGIVLMPGIAPIYLHHELHGELVMRELYAIYTVGANPMSWIETLHCPCEIEGYT